MMNLQRSAYILSIVLIAMVANAQESNVAEEFKTRLNTASSQNKTIVALFSQIKGVPGIKKQVESRGDFYYDNSGDMAMVYSTPKGDKVVMNGKDFTIIIGGKTISTNASSNPMMAQISYMMQASMSGDIAKLGRGWELKIEKLEGQYKVSIAPTERRIKKYISAMTMLFDERSMTLDLLRIDESRGGFTAYSFTSKEVNREIDPIVFIP